MKDLTISFSGGRTSAYMCWYLINYKKTEYNLHFVFANTGQEHESTLKFVDQCDKFFGLNLTWVEAVVNPLPNKGTTHKIVTYETAARNGEPFEEVIKKYGIPNQTFQPCNRELKMQPMRSLRLSIGLKYAATAIGIRADECDRINPETADKNNLVYPLAFWSPTTKEQVRHFWASQPFDLEIPEHYGNCKTCWKKSDRKLYTIAKEHPEFFDFFDEMENKYRDAGAGDQQRVFFRGHRTAKNIIEESKSFPDHKKFTDVMPELQLDFFGLDQAGGACGSESCEIFGE